VGQAVEGRWTHYRQQAITNTDANNNNRRGNIVKTRNGFVSNSSSSSFIIAIKSGDVCPHCGRKDPDILDLMKNGRIDIESYIGSLGIEDILAGRKHVWIEPMLLELENKMKEIEAKNEGWRFAYIEISNQDRVLNDLLKQSIDNGSIILISQGEE